MSGMFGLSMTEHLYRGESQDQRIVPADPRVSAIKVASDILLMGLLELGYRNSRCSRMPSALTIRLEHPPLSSPPAHQLQQKTFRVRRGGFANDPISTHVKASLVRMQSKTAWCMHMLRLSSAEGV